jgi:hypothetical protein
MHVGQYSFQPIATGLEPVKAIQQKIAFLVLVGSGSQQPVRGSLDKPGDINGV